MKKCIRCEEIKEVSEFAKDSHRKDGIRSECIICRKEYNVKYYIKNVIIYKSRSKLNNKIYKKKLKKWFFNLKSNLKCIKCGENHPGCLDFHHRNKDDKVSTISDMITNRDSIENITIEIAKCDVLCANCHRKLHWDEVKGKFKR